MRIDVQLSKSIDEANEFAAKLYGRKLNDNYRSKVAAVCFAVSQQHHNSILVLLSRNPPLHATGFTLLRPLVEAVVRGLWLSHVATDAQVEEYVNSGTKLDIASMMKSLDSVTGLTAYQSIYRKNWSALSAYTHTGEMQVQRWFKTNDIEPKYSAQEISELIKLSGLVAGLAFQAALAITSEP
jgi:hypothetical protein